MLPSVARASVSVDSPHVAGVYSQRKLLDSQGISHDECGFTPIFPAFWSNLSMNCMKEKELIGELWLQTASLCLSLRLLSVDRAFSLCLSFAACRSALRRCRSPPLTALHRGAALAGDKKRASREWGSLEDGLASAKRDAVRRRLSPVCFHRPRG